jgi:hypothetical protein
MNKNNLSFTTNRKNFYDKIDFLYNNYLSQNDKKRLIVYSIIDKLSDMIVDEATVTMITPKITNLIESLNEVDSELIKLMEIIFKYIPEEEEKEEIDVDDHTKESNQTDDFENIRSSYFGGSAEKNTSSMLDSMITKPVRKVSETPSDE